MYDDVYEKVLLAQTFALYKLQKNEQVIPYKRNRPSKLELAHFFGNLVKMCGENRIYLK